MDESVAKHLKGLSVLSFFSFVCSSSTFHQGENGQDNLIQAPCALGRTWPKAADFLVSKDETNKEPTNQRKQITRKNLIKSRAAHSVGH